MANDKQTKSKYQLKQRRKKGNGPVDQRWMTWFQSPDKPDRRRGR